MPGRKINEKMSKKLVGLFLAVILALVILMPPAGNSTRELS